MKHTIVAIVDNKPGVVSRISGMFTRRGYNIESFVTSVTGDETIYHLTFTVIGTDEEVLQLINQLEHISEVIEVYEMTDNVAHVTRELMFIRVSCTSDRRRELTEFIDCMGCRTVGVGVDSLLVEATGEPSKLDGVAALFEKYGVISIARSGAVSMLI